MAKIPTYNRLSSVNGDDLILIDGPRGTLTIKVSDLAKSQILVDSVTKMLPKIIQEKGTILFEDLPPLSQADSGWMYNIKNNFKTTSDFEEGSGNDYPAGTNVYKTANGKWDCMSGYIEGVSPTIDVLHNTNEEYILTINDVNGSKTTPNLKGPKGDTGATGPQGPKGDSGSNGSSGTNGKDGVSPTVEVATNTSTSYTLKITDANKSVTTPNLIGPQGSQGPQGPKGDTGATGPQGPQGAQGPKGDAANLDITTSAIVWNGLSFVMHKSGKTVNFATQSGALTNGLTAYNQVTIGTIASGYRPVFQVAKNIIIADGVEVRFVINSNGVIELVPFKNLNAGYTPLINETYITF